MFTWSIPKMSTLALFLAVGSAGWAQIVPPPPGATIINFDDVVAPCVFDDTTALRGVYTAQGVTFTALFNDGAGIVNECGNFGVSGGSSPNSLGINDGTSYADGGAPRTPSTLVFSPLVSKVQFNVGQAFCTQPLTVTATAVDADGVTVAVEQATPGAAMTTLTIAAPHIAKVILSTDHVCLDPFAFSTEQFVLDDLAFVPEPSVCGDGMLHSGEACDAGVANGTAASCCTAVCTLRLSSYACRPAENACDATDYCDGASAACPADAKSPFGTACPADDDPCTNDGCDGSGICVSAFEPAAACTLPTISGAAQIKLRSKISTGLGQVGFKWKKGPALPAGDYGNPAIDAPTYALCLYDGVLPFYAYAGAAHPGSWTAAPTGWQFNSSVHDGGIKQVKLKGSTAPLRAVIQVKAKGTLFASDFNLTPPVTAQLRTSDGHCWGAVFSTPDRDIAGQFKAKSD